MIVLLFFLLKSIWNNEFVSLWRPWTYALSGGTWAYRTDWLVTFYVILYFQKWSFDDFTFGKRPDFLFSDDHICMRIRTIFGNDCRKTFRPSLEPGFVNRWFFRNCRLVWQNRTSYCAGYRYYGEVFKEFSAIHYFANGKFSEFIEKIGEEKIYRKDKSSPFRP